MSAVAFAPGHISGFFEPVYHNQDMMRTGSRGAGINVSLGSISEVVTENGTKQEVEIYVNGRKSTAPTTHLAIKHLLEDRPLHVVVKTKLGLPIGQGFGMSAAGALSATYALATIIGCPQIEAMKAAHCAEIQLWTGLGDVLASCFGGIEIRKKAGLPPWGLIEHIPGRYDMVLSVVGKKLKTKTILTNPAKVSNIVTYGRYCTKKLLEHPSIERFFSLSQLFAKKTGLANDRMIKVVDAANHYGMASMCMLGNAVFAVGETDSLSQILSQFGKVFVCNVDDSGARVIKS